MKKQTSLTPLEFAKEFINDLKEELSNQEFKGQAEYYFYDNVLAADPDLKVLNSELNKIGLILKQDESQNSWILNKLS